MQKQEILRIYYLDGTIRGINADKSEFDVYCNHYVLERYDLANECSLNWIDNFYSNDSYSFTQNNFESILQLSWHSTTMGSEHDVTIFDIADECQSIMNEWPDEKVLKMWNEIKSSLPEATDRSHFDIEEVIIKSEKQELSKRKGQGLSFFLGPMKDDE